MRTIVHTAAIVVAAALAGAQSPPTPTTPPVSTTVAALQEAVSKGTPGAEAAFWARVKRDGAPLVEPIPGDTVNLLFTFVWHGDSATHNVALVNTAVASYEPAQALLARMPGTDVWYRSYPARADARF
jgi:enterochelin esterase family protein